MRNHMTILVVTVAICLRVKSYLIREDQFRSSSIKTIENYMLDGYSYRTQRSIDILDCAQACLAEKLCLSFNFNHGGNGGCHLNSRNAVGVEEYLLFFQGYMYGEMQNFSEPVFVSPGNRVPVLQYTFTCLGAKGRSGPITTDGYNDTNLQNSVRLENGKQLWTVPMTATYTIEG
ncbi:hypothetical protein QZH41_010628, partial [Actinostola sp. cb2023]